MLQFSLPQLSSTTIQNKLKITFTLGDIHGYGSKCPRPLTASYGCLVRASRDDNSDFHSNEIDSEKAREALQKLDQQLQLLSKKRVPSPKIEASEVKLTRDKSTTTTRTTEEVTGEVPGSVLVLVAVGLLLLTISYNIFFYTVIKPSVDGEF